jgi:molybdenum-dependent DNA-binding transcriptional regulator ModE
MPHKRKPLGYWNSFTNLRAELLAFMQEHGLVNIPAHIVFIRNGRTDLSNAIAQHGGSYAVALKLGIPLAHNKKPQKYWNDFENLKRELLAAMKENDWQVIPIQPKFVSAGRADIVNAITKHGGIYKVAEQLGISVETDEKPNGYWTLEVTISELQEFITEHQLGSFPTKTELETHDRHDLINAIHRNGGTYRMATLLGLTPKNKPPDYWTAENLIAEINAYMENKGMETLPLLATMLEDERQDLVNAISKFGGIHKVAAMMGKRTSGKARPMGYWTEETLRIEFEKFFEEVGFRKIPTYDELVALGRQDLTGALAKFGGVYRVGELLGVDISATGKPNGYWTLEKTRECLFEFMTSANLTTMPSGRQLLDAGRGDLLGAIDKHGGIYECARLFSLNADSLMKPRSYWDCLTNVKTEIRAFMEENCLESFPTTTFLYQQRRSDLVSASGKHGGVFAVAKACEIQYDSRKPFGYWNFETIKIELFELMEQNGFTRLPTKTFFEESGRYDLLNAIGQHGGLNHMAKLLKLEMENPYRIAGYWTLENLEKELVQFIEENNLDMMPSMEFIKSAGRGDLEGAIAKFGGILKVCQAVGIEINFDAERAFHHTVCDAEDGHFCYSKNEKIIDDWLYRHGIRHGKEVIYPYHEKYNQSHYVCDWLCGDIYIEYAGMMNLTRYARSIESKRALAQDLGLKLVVLEPKDMDDLEDRLCELFHLESHRPRQLSLF